jgi:hypothetical protein
MGAGQSRMEKPITNVFEKELHTLNNIISNILTDDDKFVNPNYNFLFEDVCNNYTILLEKELNKHLKVDLENLSSSIYLIPKKNVIVSEEDNTEINKHDICNSISKHYIKILYILSLIKHVYDLESDGDNSLAGIMERNINVVDNIMEISFCSIPHKDYDMQHADKVNFANLEGLEFFTQHFLTPTEKYAFIEQLKLIFARKPRHKFMDILCHDALIGIEEYNEIYKNKFEKPLTCDGNKSTTEKKKRVRNVDLMFEIVADNPILHSKYCFSRKKLMITLDKTVSTIKELLKLYETMKSNYIKNIEDVVGILNKIVEYKTDKFILKNISTEDLQEIITETKKTIIKFYVQSVIDFQVLLDYAKDIPNGRVV